MTVKQKTPANRGVMEIEAGRSASNMMAGVKPTTELPVSVGAGFAQCPRCHYVFTTVNNFDRHRRDEGCAYPADAGLVVNKCGLWSMPGRSAK